MLLKISVGLNSYQDFFRPNSTDCIFRLLILILEAQQVDGTSNMLRVFVQLETEMRLWQVHGAEFFFFNGHGSEHLKGKWHLKTKRP